VATEKLRAELEIITAKAEKDLKKLDRSLAGVEKRVASIGGRGGKSLKPLGEGLSAATANAGEFEKSMAAANARVIAFGASAGLIFQVQKALKETVKATVAVEKSLTDINVVLGASAASLQQFGDQLFKVAAQTGQSFKTIAAGATELARQGLGTEKTLKRLNDAMILSRLTGMGAEEAVSSLTAAVNSFAKAGINSAQVVNKMAKVDQAFAVSSDDLAKAISRVGSSAVDAGVSMDELLAITTAVQQRTARGGAVIGNAFKTIFTRIQRTDVQKKLAQIGVATRDMQGAMLPATKVLENLAAKFQDLSQIQQGQIAESVAGVFQVNILRAALGDLSSKYGVYSRAVRESATATDEAYRKNEQLNQTLDALVNKTLVNLTKAGSAIGGATLKPAIENVLGLVNSAIGAFSEGGRFEEFGKGIGKDILKGIGSFIGGPGLVLVTAGIGKLFIDFGKFTGKAIAGIFELNKSILQRKDIEAAVTAELTRQPAIIKQIERGELSAAAAAKDMLAAMRASNVEATKLAATSRSISASMMTFGPMRRGGRAHGFVPNFADPNAERAAAAAGGYRAGGIKTMSIPGEGSVMYNGAETVKQFPGMVQPAIMPPRSSAAGSNYKKAFGAAHGFDPYAAGGFVPNFNYTVTMLKRGRASASIGPVEKGQKVDVSNQQIQNLVNEGFIVDPRVKKPAGGKVDKFKDYYDTKGQVGVVSLTGASRKNGTTSTSIGQLKVFKPYIDRVKKTEGEAAALRASKEVIGFKNIQVSSLEVLRRSLQAQGEDAFNFSQAINNELIDPLARIGAQAIGGVLGNQGPRVDKIKEKMMGKRLLPKSTEGELFEKSIQLALHSPTRFMQATGGTDNAPFDFEESGSPTKNFKRHLRFDPMLQRADAKRTATSDAIRSIIKKSYNQGILIAADAVSGPLFKESGALPFMDRLKKEEISERAEKLLPTVGGGRGRGRALGLVPNFSPLTDAIKRERAAGVPASAIRVGANQALRSPGNPRGLGVYNTIHEPGGLGQGISRSRSMGINPKTHGVPNFVDFEDAKGIGGADAKTLKFMADKGMPSHLISSSGKIIIESPESAGLKEETKKGTEATKKDTEETKKSTKATGRLSRMLGRAGGPLGMAVSMGGYMMAPAIAKKTGMDEGGLMGGITGGSVGMMAGAALAPFTGGLSLLATAGLAAGGAALGYGMGKADPTEKALQELEEELQRTLGETGDFKNAMSAMAQDAMNLRELVKDGTITEEQLNQRRVQLEALYVQAVRAGKKDSLKGIGSPDTIRRILIEQLQGKQEGMGALQEAVMLAEGRKQSATAFKNIRAMTATAALPTQADFEAHERQAPSLIQHYGSLDVAAQHGMLTDLDAKLKDFGGNEKFVKTYADSFNTLFTSLTDIQGKGIAGQTRQQIIAEGFKSVMGMDATTAAKAPSFMGADFFKDSFLKVVQSLVKDGKLAAGFGEALLGENVPVKLKNQLVDIAREALASNKAGEDIVKNTQIQVKQRKDFTKANKEMLDGILDSNIDLIKGRVALDNQLKMLRASTANKQALAAIDFKSGASLAGIRGGDMAALNFQSANLGGFLDNKYGLEELQLNQTREILTGKRLNELGGSMLTSLQNQFGMGAGSGGGTVEGKNFNPIQDELSRISLMREGFDAGLFTEEGIASDLRKSVQRLNQLGGTTQLTAEQSGALTKYRTALLKYVEDLEKNNASINNLTQLKEFERSVTEANIKAQKEELEARKQFQQGNFLQGRKDAITMAATTVRGLRVIDRDFGGVTGAQKAAAAKSLRESRIRGGQGFQGAGGFFDSFMYDRDDAALAFDSAMVELGEDIKGSTKSAIKDIASGAKDFKESMRDIFANLAAKMADRGIDMGVDALFGFFESLANSAKKSQGGYIPRGYNQGGVVTGGSGVRDDVMTFMQGGEYVIKKSSAQKIGYGTLNAINSYASGGQARVSLAKDFMYSGEDTSRPTGGGFAMSRRLSSAGIFSDDPATNRMFERERTLASYKQYRLQEMERRRLAINAVKDQKRSRRNQAYISAVMTIGAGALHSKAEGETFGGGPSRTESNPMGGKAWEGKPVEKGARGGSPALVMGGEYIMSPQTTAKYGTGFMAELNRGRMPGYNMGGLVGGQGGAGGSSVTTNNLNLAINIDKGGKTQVQSESQSGQGENSERGDEKEVEKQKKLGEAIRGVVLKEIERQQRPGGLLRDNATYAGGRRP